MAPITIASATSTSCSLASGTSSLRRAVRFSESAKLKTRLSSVAQEGSIRAFGGGLVGEARDIVDEGQELNIFAQVSNIKFSSWKGSSKTITSNLSKGHSQVTGGIVALGKFDALHIGHRELAIQASRLGTPYLLSFTGIAEVLGWEPRVPIVAKCDREWVLTSWAQHCGNVVPKEYQIEFSTVRHLTPREFVEKLTKELGVCGVVAGENYRFGYKAAGDASDLVNLSNEYGINAYIIDTVMDKHQLAGAVNSPNDRGQVSSTRVRRALALGDMKYVSELLGRRHRILLVLKDFETSCSIISKYKISASKLCLLNLPPKDGEYRHCSIMFSAEKPVSCRVFIDTTHIHLETCEVGIFTSDNLAKMQTLAIELSEIGVG